MGIFSKSTWKDWARQWGLQYHKPSFLGTSREWMAGSYRGYLIKTGWLGDRNVEFYVMVRFPKGQDPVVIRQRLLDDMALADMPGWKKLKPAESAKPSKLVAFPNGGAVQLARATLVGVKPLILDESSVVWTIPCPWRRPGVERLQGWVEKLVVALSQVTRPFEDRCEQCGRTLGGRYAMVNDVPVHLCETCQQDLVQKGRMAEHAYDQTEANHLVGTLYGSVGAAVGGATWALIAFTTQRMFALVAIGIALLVGFAYRLGAKKLDLAGQAIGILLTLAGVLFGDVLFYAALVMRERPELGFRPDLGILVFLRVLKNAPGEILFSLVFGVVGSIYVARMLARPKFVPKIEQADETKAAA